MLNTTRTPEVAMAESVARTKGMTGPESLSPYAKGYADALVERAYPLEEIIELGDRIEEVRKRKKEHVDNQRYEEGSRVRDEERELIGRRDDLLASELSRLMTPRRTTLVPPAVLWVAADATEDLSDVVETEPISILHASRLTEDSLTRWLIDLAQRELKMAAAHGPRFGPAHPTSFPPEFATMLRTLVGREVWLATAPCCVCDGATLEMKSQNFADVMSAVTEIMISLTSGQSVAVYDVEAKPESQYGDMPPCRAHVHMRWGRWTPDKRT